MCGLKMAVSAVAGLVVGAIVSYVFLERKYEAIVETELEAERKYYSTKLDNVLQDYADRLNAAETVMKDAAKIKRAASKVNKVLAEDVSEMEQRKTEEDGNDERDILLSQIHDEALPHTTRLEALNNLMRQFPDEYDADEFLEVIHGYAATYEEQEHLYEMHDGDLEGVGPNTWVNDFGQLTDEEPAGPVIVSDESYYEGVIYNDGLGNGAKIYYYKEDGVYCNSDEVKLSTDFVRKTIGEDAMNQIQRLSVIFVRNDKQHSKYEVWAKDASYAAEVLGRIETPFEKDERRRRTSRRDKK